MRPPAWPPDTLQEAMRLDAEGWTYPNIGKKIGKSADAVWQKLKRRGRTEEVMPTEPLRETRGSATKGALSESRLGPLPEKLAAGVPLGSECAPVLDSRILNAPAGPRPPAASSPAVHTSKSRAEAWMCVPDLQAPFHAPGALEFCERVRREFGVPKDNVILLGDEMDNFHGKGLDKPRDPDAEHTPRQELAAGVEELKRWYATYPRMRVCRSNHGTRYERRAAEAEISSQWMRLYREVIEAPEGWEWKDRWILPASKQPFLAEHGHEGKSSTEAKVLEHGFSTVHGHFTKALIVWVSNHLGRRLWGQCAGALIDYETYAFKYARKYPRKPDNGVSIILDGGRIPLWVPYYA